MVGVVIGNYQIVQKLGEGGMGAVYLGHHTLLGRRAAIKVLLPALSARTDIVNRFFNEARAVTSISDPGIVQVFDFGFHSDGSAFIVMELLEGEPLDRRLARLGRLPVHDALRLCRQVASSLAAAHAQHIIHRDLKPENIFLVPDGEVASGERSKILDFGIAKLSDEHPGKIKTSTGMLMGTPSYMSPEQCRGVAEIDHRSDIYSLGCVLFGLLTGRPPFEGEGIGDIISAQIREPAPPPSSKAPGIPPHVDALVLRCLAKAPAERFQTMAELAATIGQLLPYVSADALPAYGHITAGAPPASVPPTYPPHHFTPPPASVPPTYPPHQSTPPSPTPPPGYASPVAPTTLGAGAGQLAASLPATHPPSRSPRIGRWIAGALVLGAVGAGIAIVGMRHGETREVAQEPAAVASSAPPSSAPPAAPDAGTVVAAAPTAPIAPPPASGPPASPAIPSSPEAAQIDAGSPESAEPAPPVAPHEPAMRPSRRRDHHKTTTPPALPPSTPASPSHAPPAQKCSKADFASVYDAPSPPLAAVRAALKNLKSCHDAGAISDADFDRYQSALVAKM